MPETHSAMFCVRYLLICDHTGSSLLLRVSGLGKQGLLFIVVCGFLTAGASRCRAQAVDAQASDIAACGSWSMQAQ